MSTKQSSIVVAVAAVFALASGCVHEARARPDNALARIMPSMHSMAPIKPSTPEALDPLSSGVRADAGVAKRFTADNITVEEPTFHEHHSLAWQRSVREYTADVLNRAVALPLPSPTSDETKNEAPLQSRARFDWTFDHRDSMEGERHVTIALETVLPDGRVVTSKEVKGAVSLWNEAGLENSMLAASMAGLGTALGANLLVATGASTSPIGWAVMGGACTLSAIALGAACLTSIMRMDAVEERWSDLYLQALRAHAADVRHVLVDSGVPALASSAGGHGAQGERPEREDGP
jgi:hypothetical protein